MDYSAIGTKCKVDKKEIIKLKLPFAFEAIDLHMESGSSEPYFLNGSRISTREGLQIVASIFYCSYDIKKRVLMHDFANPEIAKQIEDKIHEFEDALYEGGQGRTAAEIKDVAEQSLKVMSGFVLVLFILICLAAC